MYFYVNSPYRLHSSNVAIGKSGETIHQFCHNSYYLHKILNSKSFKTKMVQIVAICVVAKLCVTFGVAILLFFEGEKLPNSPV